MKVVIPYFPVELKYTSVLPGVAAIYLFITGHFIWSIVLLLLIGAILTTEYVTEIDLKEKKIEDYLSILWIPFDKEVLMFTTLQKIIIQKGNYAQTINTRIQSRQMDWSDFTATLVYDNNQFFDLLTKTRKKEVLKGIKEFAEFLSVEVEDHSTTHPYTVDLARIGDLN